MKIVDVLKYEFLALLKADGREVTVDLLRGSVDRAKFTETIPLHETPYWHTFHGYALRYFFTVYANDLAYRICMFDFRPDRTSLAESNGYIPFIIGDMKNWEDDGYGILAEPWKSVDGIQIMVYRRNQ